MSLGTFPCTNESYSCGSRPKNMMILVEKIGVQKKVSWIQDDITSEEIIVGIWSNCLNCDKVNEHYDYCLEGTNSGALNVGTGFRYPNYICPNYSEKI